MRESNRQREDEIKKEFSEFLLKEAQLEEELSKLPEDDPRRAELEKELALTR